MKTIEISLKIAVLAGFVALQSGCGMVEGKAEAEVDARAFLDQRVADGGAGDASAYAAEFFEATTKEDWAEIKDLVVKANGNLKSYALMTFDVDANASTDKRNGVMVTLVYETTYERGNGQETLSLFRPEGGTKFEIIGHNYNTPEINAAMKR